MFLLLSSASFVVAGLGKAYFNILNDQEYNFALKEEVETALSSKAFAVEITAAPRISDFAMGTMIKELNAMNQLHINQDTQLTELSKRNQMLEGPGEVTRLEALTKLRSKVRRRASRLEKWRIKMTGTNKVQRVRDILKLEASIENVKTYIGVLEKAAEAPRAAAKMLKDAESEFRALDQKVVSLRLKIKLGGGTVGPRLRLDNFKLLPDLAEVEVIKAAAQSGRMSATTAVLLFLTLEAVGTVLYFFLDSKTTWFHDKPGAVPVPLQQKINKLSKGQNPDEVIRERCVGMHLFASKIEGVAQESCVFTFLRSVTLFFPRNH